MGVPVETRGRRRAAALANTMLTLLILPPGLLKGNHLAHVLPVAQAFLPGPTVLLHRRLRLSTVYRKGRRWCPELQLAGFCCYPRASHREEVASVPRL